MLLQLLKPFWLSIVKWGAIAGAFVFAVFKIRQSGKDTVEKDNLEEILKAVIIRDEIERNITNSTDTERMRLRQKWQKK